MSSLLSSFLAVPVPGAPWDVAPVDLFGGAAASPSPATHLATEAVLAERDGARSRLTGLPARLLALPGLGKGVGACTVRAGRPRPAAHVLRDAASPRERLAVALHVRELE